VAAEAGDTRRRVGHDVAAHQLLVEVGQHRIAEPGDGPLALDAAPASFPGLLRSRRRRARRTHKLAGFLRSRNRVSNQTPIQDAPDDVGRQSGGVGLERRRAAASAAGLFQRRALLDLGLGLLRRTVDEVVDKVVEGVLPREGGRRAPGPRLRQGSSVGRGRGQFGRRLLLNDGRLQTAVGDVVEVVVELRTEVAGRTALARSAPNRHIAEARASAALRR